VFDLVYRTGKSVADAASELGFGAKLSGEELAEVCAKVIASSPKAVADIRRGKLAAVKALVGGVMKETRGAADPRATEAELKRQLGL